MYYTEHNNKWPGFTGPIRTAGGRRKGIGVPEQVPSGVRANSHLMAGATKVVRALLTAEDDSASFGSCLALVATAKGLAHSLCQAVPLRTECNHRADRGGPKFNEKHYKCKQHGLFGLFVVPAGPWR